MTPKRRGVTLSQTCSEPQTSQAGPLIAGNIAPITNEHISKVPSKMDMSTATLDATFWMTAGVILFLLVLSGFFSGSETALTAASRGKLHSLADKGNKGAERLHRHPGETCKAFRSGAGPMHEGMVRPATG